MTTLRATGISVPKQPLRLQGGTMMDAGMNAQEEAGFGIAAANRLASERQAANTQIRAANQAGMSKLGSAVGGVAGSFWGPIGSMVGSAAGGMLGSMIG